MEIKQFKERTSVRDFTSKKLTKKEIKDVTEVINNSPTSTNSQQFSAIIITDQKTKDWMYKKNWYQKHVQDSAAIILFVADRTRVAYIEDKQKIMPSRKLRNHEFMRATVDATIAATYAHDALITMGYGVTFIGGPLTYAEDLHKKLNLPDTTMVVVGLSIGKAKSTEGFKPKMQKVFMEKYSKKDTIANLKEYDKVMKAYYTKRGTTGDYTKLIINTSGVKKSYAEPFENGGKYIGDKFKNFR